MSLIILSIDYATATIILPVWYRIDFANVCNLNNCGLMQACWTFDAAISACIQRMVQLQYVLGTGKYS